MYGKRRTIPLNVSVWMEKDVKVRKATASSGLMPDETRVSVFLSRQFYSDMLELSSERHRQLARFEYNRKTFLKKQKQKADTNMPGLLPYIEQYKEDLKDEATFCRYDQFRSPSLQSMNNSSSINSDATYPPRRRLPERKKGPQRPQISLERINQLSQPRNQRKRSIFIDQRRSNPVQTSPVEEILDNTDDFSFEESFTVREQPNPVSDRRFQKLIHLFSEVYEQAPSTIPAKTTLPPIERKDHRDIRNDSYLIDACVILPLSILFLEIDEIVKLIFIMKSSETILLGPWRTRRNENISFLSSCTILQQYSTCLHARGFENVTTDTTTTTSINTDNGSMK